jgi:fructose-1,6-bisphosphatase/inositol monophosphatase family enzyme
MTGRSFIRRDPFEGTGAHRRELRLRIEGVIALGMAIVATGITAAMWFRTLAPVLQGTLLK